jgi:uncharacterized protein
MLAIIEESYKVFTTDEKQQVKDGLGEFGRKPEFPGFDGNYETEYLSVTHFIIDKLERFKVFKGRELNSHSPRVAGYLEVVALFQPIRMNLADRNLSPQEMITVLRRRV